MSFFYVVLLLGLIGKTWDLACILAQQKPGTCISENPGPSVNPCFCRRFFVRLRGFFGVLDFRESGVPL